MGFPNPDRPVAHFNVVGATGTPYDRRRGRPAPGHRKPCPRRGRARDTDPSTFTPAKTGLSAQDIQLRTGRRGWLTGSHDFPGDYTAVPTGSNCHTKPRTLGDGHEHERREPSLPHARLLHPAHQLDGQRPGDSTGQAALRLAGHEFKDNVDIPALYTLKFRTKLEDRALMDGVTPGGEARPLGLHCHIFFHATRA